MSEIIVHPKTMQYEILLTATTPISHHDPAIQNDSNKNLFNRQKQILTMELLDSYAPPSQEKIDLITATNPVPIEVADLCANMSFPEFVAVVIVRMFLDSYNTRDGLGLFSGMERYSRLEDRLHMAAIVAPKLNVLWDRLCESLQTPIDGSDNDMALLNVLSLPLATQRAVLGAIRSDHRTIIKSARTWHRLVKLDNEEYASVAGKVAMVTPMQTMSFDAAKMDDISSRAIVDVPAVSSNSLRHQVVRHPAWLHLVEMLGLEADEPGKGKLPSGAEAIFDNGGNIEAGAKQPSNTFVLRNQIKASYPSLDLLGGVADSFDLGEGKLKAAGWLVCKENRDALRGSPAYDLPATKISAHDMLDDVTNTRQAGEVGTGQMIYSFETLAAGVQVVYRMNLTPYTPILTRGALIAATETFLENGGIIGGQSARGFGFMRGEWITRPADAGDETARERYEDYLRKNRDKLREMLADGTMGTGERKQSAVAGAWEWLKRVVVMS